MPATNYYGQCIYLNGTTQLYNALVQSASIAAQYIQTNGIVELTAGQTLEARTYNGGAAVNDSVSASNSWFTINEINPTF